MIWDTIDGDMFDFLPMYNRMTHELPSKCRVAEVGVANGKSAICLAELIQATGRKFELHMVDNLAYGGRKQLQEIIRNVQRSGLSENIHLLLPCSSLDAACEYPDDFFNFVFLDSSHDYEQTKAEIRLWWRKIFPGGYLAGHDANDEKVKDAVYEVIPQQFIAIHPTDAGYGTWEIRKSNGAHLRE